MNKLLFCIVLVAFSSCRLVPNRMWITPKDYKFAKDTSDSHKGPYILQKDDKFELHIFSNEGFKLVDVTSTNLSQSASNEGILYSIDENGEAKMPVIGRIVLNGLSIKEAENLLQEKYAKYYHDPFVLLRVVSRRVFVFRTDVGSGSVVQLQNDHTSLFEALALAGGLTEYSKAYTIKIIRGDYKNPQIFLADLSTPDGIKNAELEIYPNDIIYIDGGAVLRKRLTNDFLPFLSVLTSLLVLIAYFKL